MSNLEDSGNLIIAATIANIGEKLKKVEIPEGTIFEHLSKVGPNAIEISSRTGEPFLHTEKRKRDQ